MDIKIIYEDNDLVVVDKPAGIAVFPEGNIKGETLVDLLLQKYPGLNKAGEAPRYGIVHRLDKDTSGLLMVAKTTEALIFLQKKFINREVEKKYTALANGTIKDDVGTIDTLLGRSPGDPRKQAVIEKGERQAVTEYKVLKRFAGYTLLEATIKTGRKHQIRAHLTHIHHPVAGDRLYGFKDSPTPEGLTRQFLHASYIKMQLPSGKVQEFHSDLPKDLQTILEKLT